MALFISKKRELRIIVKPSDRTFDEARRPVIIRGERVEFLNHRFQSDDPGLVDWLCRHPLCGSHFICADPAAVTAAREKHPKVGPIMVHGANTTATREAAPDETPAPLDKPADPMHFETPLTKEEIDIMIENKLDDFFERIVTIFHSQGVPDKPEHQKRTFKCPHCDEVFRSGIEVGKHKKLAHPSATAPATPDVNPQPV